LYEEEYCEEGLDYAVSVEEPRVMVLSVEREEGIVYSKLPCIRRVAGLCDERADQVWWALAWK